MISPKVLVVLPLYNARPYVQAAIDSILSQTCTDFVLLVINDGSTDGSEQVAAAYQDRGVILWHQRNLGPGAAMNRAIQYAFELQIPFIARMDADDISLPLRLETQLRLLEDHPGAAACSANCRYIDSETGLVIGSSTISTSPALIRREIAHGLRGLIQGASIFRTSALAGVGRYRSQFKRAEEVDVFLRLMEHHELLNCGDFLYDIRIRADSYSLKNVRQNILYQFYALDCAKNRLAEKPEHAFETYLQQMPLTTKFRVWREEQVLKLWRSHLHKKHLPSLLLAALLDPRRVWFRVLRKLEERKQL